MAEKFSEVFLPSTTGQVVTIPKEVNQLTIKDGIIFIGKEHPNHSKSYCCQFLMVLVLLLVFGVGAIMIKPMFGQLPTIVLRDLRDNSLLDRSIIKSSTSITQTTSQTTNSQSNVTILYSMVNPYTSLPSYYKISSVYIARAYQTTLSFFMQNGPSWTYLDDVSVKNTYGTELLNNGNFENNSTLYWRGWSNANIVVGSNAHTGQRCHSEGASAGTNLSQTFYTTPGNVLNITFWIQWKGTGSPISTKVTIYP
ncbi:unnamed protein product [Rotaria sordida]|uniref:Uncharacterized protein n=1 Tax=Rotaria sordida TaxID=392033 RepID=A0A815SIY8_9BILA|nr:unnamed protein product [Rotaria sordida]